MVLNVSEIKNLKDYIKNPVDTGCCAIPFFHGTRMHALTATEEDRKLFHSACDQVISFAKKLVRNCPIDDETLKEYNITKNPLFLGSVVSQYKTPSYEYGAFYLTTGYSRAITYANNAGGELGQWAYSQCVGFRELSITPDAETAEATKIVIDEYEKYKNSEQIILVYSGVRFEDLSTERGAPLLLYDKDGIPNTEYNTYKINDLYKSTESDSKSYVRAFRLSRPEAYTGGIIRQKDFKEGFSVFTKIRDIDKYLKRNRSKCLRSLL